MKKDTLTDFDSHVAKCEEKMQQAFSDSAWKGDENTYNPKCSRCGVRPPGECYECVDNETVCYNCMTESD